MAEPSLPPQPSGTPWPTLEWPRGDLGDVGDPVAVDRLVRGVVADQPPRLGQTLAIVVVHHGRLVAEAYGPGVGPDTALISWSVAKSALHAVVGRLVASGGLDVDAPAGVAAWSDDERSAITPGDLLRMRPGLRWVEDYVDDMVSDVIEMLFGGGAADMGAFAASFPLEHPPGAVWNYSSGTSNIVSMLCRDAICRGGPDAEAAYRRFVHQALLDPLGMRSATLTFDGAGTWVGSSYLHATARDFARLGLLYLRDGVWEDAPLLPSGWVDRARTSQATDPERGEGYGEHWWVLDDGLGSFCASGYEGQRIVVCPALDLVVVRLGKTPASLGEAWHEHLAALVRAIAAA